ncbi:hypothetical protein KEM48_002568 [Puccinia striiformis f. sp. tritici PST-130]|nr:hypothetical protein KEM48_002568 [Puccinia striiformis f. sp. tritici PST-130]
MADHHTTLTDLTQLVPDSSSSSSTSEQQQPTADQTVAVLKSRFLSDLPYLWLSPRCLISLALNKNSPINSDQSLNAYASDWWDCSQDRRKRIESDAGQGFGGDQSIITRGESGSGKSEARRLALRFIVDISSALPGKKGSKLVQQIPAAQFILESFGNAHTLENSNASRFGQYTELQFTETGKLCGLKSLEYYLQRSRVVNRPSGEQERAYLFLDQSPTATGLAQLPGQALRLNNDQPGHQPFRFLSQARNQSGQATAASDSQQFVRLKQAFKAIGFSKKAVASTCQLLAAILHLGNLEFVIDKSKNAEAATISNPPLLDVVASFLGVKSETLESTLTYQTRMVSGERCTIFLDSEGASQNRDDLAKMLYGLLFSWLNETINQKLCKDDFTTFISMIDLPGTQTIYLEVEPRGSLERTFVKNKAEYLTEGLDTQLPGLQTPFYDNAEILRVLTHVPGGLVHIIDDQSRRPNKTEQTMLDAMGRRWGNNTSFTYKDGDERLDRPGSFTCSHYSGPVTYSVEGFLIQNRDVVSPDYLTLFGASRRASTGAGSTNSFIRQLFADADLATTTHPLSEKTIVAAQQLQRPMRAPSTRRKNRHDVPEKSATDDPVEEVTKKDAAGKVETDGKLVVSEFNESLSTLLETLQDTKTWFIFCLKSNDSQLSNQFDGKLVKQQVKFFNLPELAKRLKNDWMVSLENNEWWERYKGCDPIASDVVRLSLVSWEEKIAGIKTLMGWDDLDIKLGNYKIFMNDAGFRQLEDRLRAVDEDEQRKYQEKAAVQAHGNSSEIGLPLVSHAAGQAGHMGGGGGYYDDDRKTMMTETEGGYGSPNQENESKSYLGTDRYAPSRNMFDSTGKPSDTEKEALNHDDATPGRGETAEEVVPESSLRKKWLILVWSLTFYVPNFALTYLGRMKRPDVRLAWREKLAINIVIWFCCAIAVFVIAIMGNLIVLKIAIRGEVFDLTSFAPLHYPSVVPTKAVQSYGGTDATNLFPVQVSALCSGNGNGISQYIIQSGANTTSLEPNSVYHDFRASTSDPRPDWYFQQMYYLRYNYRRGFMGKTPKEIQSLSRNGRKSIAILDGSVYDLTDYITVGPGIKTPTGTSPPSVDSQFMSPDIVQLFQQGAGGDITDKFNALNMDRNVKEAQRICLRNLFFVGKVDNRQSAKCLFAQYILLIFSMMMVSIIGFKFLAALQFGKARQPEDHEKFVIIQIPCYTEGEESLRRAIDSITQLKYDDKRKLLFIVCDGMIIGSGNDRPTPRIVLDILGSDPSQNPEALSVLSLGEGAKQHNMAKTLSSNKNVIGVNPAFYEYALMIDADTTVDKFSLNRMISAMMHDSRIIGLCGETSLSNARHSWTTMMQVYEYFISHHLSKAFESLFGSVTCLPGCFTLYRLRTNEHKPLLVSNQIIDAYSVNRVDTLHMKNLLHLGEDRYLTTLLLKTFPSFKTTFIQDAYAKTIAPDEWAILLSQRRRWINSTIHNLAELLMIERLCGFCCFSMRFVVFIDLFSTLIQPVIVAYLAYLLYLIGSKSGLVPTTSLIMIAAIYGLQALIFIFHRKFEHIGWMFFYLLAIPIFSFLIPVYSFWKMDDFSWGNTRVVLGEAGKKMVIHEEGKFDPSSIPLKTWQEYENELWERGSNQSIGAIIADKRNASAKEASLYGQETSYDPPMMMPYSRTHSPGLNELNQDGRSLLSGYPGGGGSIMLMPPGGNGGVGYMDPMSGRAMSVHSYGGAQGMMAPNRGMNDSPSRHASFIPPNQNMNSVMMPNMGMGMGGGSMYGPVPGFMNAQNVESLSRRGSGAGFPVPNNRTGLPSDEQIIADIQAVLARADLNTITKKGVRQELESMYGTELGDKKSFVNQAIEDQLG